MLWSLVKAIGMEWDMLLEESPPMSMPDMSWFIVEDMVVVACCGYGISIRR